MWAFYTSDCKIDFGILVFAKLFATSENITIKNQTQYKTYTHHAQLFTKVSVIATQRRNFINFPIWKLVSSNHILCHDSREPCLRIQIFFR